MNEYKGYRAQVKFDSAGDMLVGYVLGIRGKVTFEGTSVKGLERAFHASVDAYLESCKKQGQEPERPFSGQFRLRIDPELHRDLVVAADGAGMSLNKFVIEALSKVVNSK